PPPALRAVAPAQALARRPRRPARRRLAEGGPVHPGRARDQGDPRRGGRRRHAPRHRRCRAALPVPASGRRPTGERRPAGGERCSPHPHNFTDRLVRPGDQAFFDIIQSFVGYRTCYYRTFSVGRATAAQISAYKKAREWMDEAIALIKPGVTTDRIARAFPK